MPALQPPSMQIGALPSGASSVTPLPPGPALAYGFNEGLPSLVQQKAGNSTAAAPATFTLSAIPATTAGTFLVCCMSIAESAAATVSTPTNWTAVAGASAGNAGNTLGGRVFVYPNNPGGITSVVFSTITGANGVAVWFGEFANAQALDAVYAAATFVNTSTTPSATAYVPAAGPVLLVGFECDVTGQAYTPANVGANWVAGTTATSTLGATNTIIRPFYVVTDPTSNLTYQLAGTLAGTLANGASLISVLLATSGPLTQPQPQGWAGAPAVAGAWGALGNTKPGGAGSGQ
jgi:hypothetical protein